MRIRTDRMYPINSMHTSIYCACPTERSNECVYSRPRHYKKPGYEGGIIFVYPSLRNDFDNNLLLLDIDYRIHSQILSNNTLRVFILRDC